jgi:hypothetical protein
MFDILRSMPIDPDDPLLEIERKMENNEYDEIFYEKRKSRRVLANRKHFLDKDEVASLCSQPLTWKQIEKKLGVPAQIIADFARSHGIEKVHTPAGRKKTGNAMTQKEIARRYYEKNSPSVEELDRLMVIYGGFIGLLAFKLEKSFQITRNMLKFRGKYDEWIKYNFHLGKGGAPKTLPPKEK